MFQKWIDDITLKDQTPYSTIDHDNEKFILRNYEFTVKEKHGEEWIITKDAIVINRVKIKGLFSKQTNIDTETFAMADVSELQLNRSGYQCNLRLTGKTPKWWSRGFLLGVGDTFTILAAAAFIVQQKQGYELEVNIAEELTLMRQMLDTGELPKDGVEKMRKRGMFDAIRWTGPTIAPTSEPSPSSPATTLSVADELSKLKALLDDGILTQEEFDHKKKKLLGM